MLDAQDADTLFEALNDVMAAMQRIEKIVTDDDALDDAHDHLDQAKYDMAKMLEEFEDDRTKDWDTPLGDL